MKLNKVNFIKDLIGINLLIKQWKLLAKFKKSKSIHQKLMIKRKMHKKHWWIILIGRSFKLKGKIPKLHFQIGIYFENNNWFFSCFKKFNLLKDKRKEGNIFLFIFCLLYLTYQKVILKFFTFGMQVIPRYHDLMLFKMTLN